MIKKIIFIVFVLLALVFVGKQIYEQYNVKKYQSKTIGTITKFDHATLSRYVLYYKYSVKNKRYNNKIDVSFFKCDDGTKGCVGKKFYVYYSSKNPEYSRIYLGKYEKYKTTVEFFK